MRSQESVGFSSWRKVRGPMISTNPASLWYGQVPWTSKERGGCGVKVKMKWKRRWVWGGWQSAYHALGPAVPGTWVKNFTCRGLQEKQNSQKIQVRLRKGGMPFKDIKVRDTFPDKSIIYKLFKYCPVIIFSLHFAFPSVIPSPPLPLYYAAWIFLEEEWGTFCSLVYPVSDLEPALVPTN